MEVGTTANLTFLWLFSIELLWRHYCTDRHWVQTYSMTT